jgi:hypothetical protein
MTYRRKFFTLSGLVAVLFLVYILSLIFDPQRSASRSALYTWLDPRLLDQADAIVIQSPGLAVNLVRRNNVWLVSRQGNEYPARQLRVGDLLSALSRRAAYPVMATSAFSHEQLGLGGSAGSTGASYGEGISRITVRGGAGLPLLDLLVGKGTTNREVYLRKAGRDEARSGEDIFTVYTGSAPSSWYDLRLFPDRIDAGEVQRLKVYPLKGEGYGTGSFLSFTRSGNGWITTNSAVPRPDTGRIDTYVRGILDAEGEDFASSLTPPSDGKIVLELEDGTVLTLNVSPEDEGTGQRRATVSGSPYVYALAGWTVERLFREAL